jgi:hypothetical protein
MDGNHFSPTQQAILDLLSDGRAHSVEELHECLSDDLSPTTAIYHHVSVIRSKLRPKGEGVGYVRNDKGSFYYLTRLMSSPYLE